MSAWTETPRTRTPNPRSARRRARDRIATFVANAAQYTAASYTLQQIARAELLTFQRGSQLFSKRLHDIRGAKVQAISSVSGMLRLVTGCFGSRRLRSRACQRRRAIPH